MDKRAFGKHLNKTRAAAKITIEVLAERTDVSVSFLNGVFSGRAYPSVETFVKLVNVLGCSANELLRGAPWSVDETAIDPRLLPIRELPPARARHVCNVLDAVLTDLEEAEESVLSEKVTAAGGTFPPAIFGACRPQVPASFPLSPLRSPSSPPRPAPVQREGEGRTKKRGKPLPGEGSCFPL